MKLKELAKKTGKPLGELLLEIAQHPSFEGKIPTGESETPQELATKIEERAAEYKAEEMLKVEGKLTVKEKNALTKKCMNMAVIETIREHSLAAIEFAGQVQGAEEVAAFNRGRNQAWIAEAKGKSAEIKELIQSTQDNLNAFLDTAETVAAEQSDLMQLALDLNAMTSSIPKFL